MERKREMRHLLGVGGARKHYVCEVDTAVTVMALVDHKGVGWNAVGVNIVRTKQINKFSYTKTTQQKNGSEIIFTPASWT